MDFNFDGYHDLIQSYGVGNSEDEYLVGDWNGDGRDNIAVRRGNQIWMDFNFDGYHDLIQSYGVGNSEDEYLVGNWNGDNRENIAVRRGNQIWMDFNFDGFHDFIQSYGNGTKEMPLFDPTYGYGLVNAAAAVAQSLAQPTFADVPNLGGNQWGNDLVNAPEVWAQGFTGQGVTVAVIDSGVDINHEDLRDNIWTNPGEIAGNGIDDDGNGFIDDVNGWNFGSNNNNVMDSGSHGTYVAGAIAAMSNNFGITGVAHNAQIMPIRITNNNDDLTENLANGIRYAVDNGASVINISLGRWAELPEITDALAYAASNNVIPVMSAGNDSEPIPTTPARNAIQYGLSVGAVDSNSNIWSDSNRAGSDINMRHIVAPGVNVHSTVPGNQYVTSGGTSIAAPYVAGVVALMIEANPNLTHAQVRQIITDSAIALA
ncbi:MAG: S8 family serine peptidase [Symploca sp. SIO2D2]|nr:S8 family serine peptidase [Symploca sp. SIO2D2]